MPTVLQTAPKSYPTRANSAASKSVGWNRDQTPAVSRCQPKPPERPPELTGRLASRNARSRGGRTCCRGECRPARSPRRRLRSVRPRSRRCRRGMRHRCDHRGGGGDDAWTSYIRTNSGPRCSRGVSLLCSCRVLGAAVDGCILLPSPKPISPFGSPYSNTAHTVPRTCPQFRCFAGTEPGQLAEADPEAFPKLRARRLGCGRPGVG